MDHLLRASLKDKIPCLTHMGIDFLKTCGILLLRCGKMLSKSIEKNKVLQNAQMIQQYKAQPAALPKGSLIFCTERNACTSETLRNNAAIHKILEELT